MPQQNKFIYIAYNKPVGIVCTTEKIEGNIIDAIKHPEKIIPIGRLDKDSEGLILLTNDSSIINKIIHPDFEHEKEYVVTLNLPLRNQFLKDIADGVNIGDAITKPCKIKAEPNARRIFRIVLKQGLNRQIRRMCNVFKYQVIKLERVRIMNIKLGKLKTGEWRDLSEEELNDLFSQLK
ncbi:MAG: pseudouridine synthase [Bacteroidota bacterium]